MKAVKRRAFAMLTIGLVVACIAFGALSTAAAAQPGPGFAFGAGTIESPPFTETFEFTAAGGPNAATGTMTWTLEQTGGSSLTLVAEVLCIGVTGNQARIVGLQSPPGDSGNVLWFDVEDNGTPGAGLDRFEAQFGFAPTPLALCQFPLEGTRTITSGEIVVGGAGAGCPPNNDEDNDGLNDNDESSVFLTRLGNDDSDFDGIADGNDDANGNGEDDEDEDDDEDDGCPDEDSDDDGEDDEDEDDEEDD